MDTKVGTRSFSILLLSLKQFHIKHETSINYFFEIYYILINLDTSSMIISFLP